MPGGVARLSFDPPSVQHEREMHAAFADFVSSMRAKGIPVAGHMHTQVVGGRTFTP